MKRILLLGGNSLTNSRIERYNLNFINKIDKEYISLWDLISEENSIYLNESDDLLYLMSSKSTDFRRRLIFVSDLARNLHHSYSFRIKLRNILGLHIHPKNFLGVKGFLRYFLNLSNYLMYLFFILGVFRFPKSLLIRLLKFNFTDYLTFEKTLESMNIDCIVIFTTGHDNLSFLLSFFDNNHQAKKVLVILNWDNTSSKAIIPDVFDTVCLWNENQINEVVRFSKLNRSKLTVIGSKIADKAYYNYPPIWNKKDGSNANKLLFLGQQNLCDEMTEVINLNNFILLNKTGYSSLVYRPNPHKKSKHDSIKLNHLGVETHFENEINLRDFKGIICFPTTMVFEIILSKVPALMYIPKHLDYLFSPHTTWKYFHFNSLRTTSPIPVVKSPGDLYDCLIGGIPDQDFYSPTILNSSFPKFSESFENRLDRILSEMMSSML